MQFSLFGAAMAQPSLADFDGALIGGGHWQRGGERESEPETEDERPTARLAVPVIDRWRADYLREAFHERGVPASEQPIVAVDGRFIVYTSFSRELWAEAGRWTIGQMHVPPVGFELSVGALRLWAVTAGRTDDAGYVLGTDQPDDVMHTISGAQLSRMGLAAVSLTARSGGPGWRVTSRKRLRRLAELLGEPPTGSGRDWPTS